MESISKYAGRQIKLYRKIQRLTLQELADRISKSRATVSKYESGDIVLDIDTLEDIANALNVHISKLLDDPDKRTMVMEDYVEEPKAVLIRKNPFYQSDRLYIYYYDGRIKRIRDGIIDVFKDEKDGDGYKASLVLSVKTENGMGSETRYEGSVVYSDMLIRFSFLNLYNRLEEDLLYIFNPLDCRESTEGLLCGISTADLLPCAFKCFVSLTPVERGKDLKKKLIFTKENLATWQDINMMVLENKLVIPE